jgi:hypothetical protein
LATAIIAHVPSFPVACPKSKLRSYLLRAFGHLQPVQGRPVDAERTGEVHHGLAGIHPPQRFPPLMSGHLERATEPHPRRLRALTALAGAGRISSRSNSARQPSTVSISRPCGVVVSAHVSLSDRKPAQLSVTAARTLSRSRVDRASLSSRVTTRTSPGSSRLRTLASSARSPRAQLAFSR